MAILQILPSPPSLHSTACFRSFPKFYVLKASVNGDHTVSPPPQPARRGRKKSTSTATTTATTSPTKKPRRTKKVQPETNKSDEEEDEELEDFDDGIDFPYEDPPLVCCFGAARKEFVPTVRVSEEQMHPDIYSDWKMMQWNPPEFARALGGSPSNVAIALVRLGGRAAFMGKVGGDDYGQNLVLMMNKEKVQTRGVKIDANEKTGCAYMKITFDGKGKMKVEKVKEAAEDSLLSSELNLSVLKEVLSGSQIHPLFLMISINCLNPVRFETILRCPIQIAVEMRLSNYVMMPPKEWHFLLFGNF